MGWAAIAFLVFMAVPVFAGRFLSVSSHPDDVDV